MTRLLFEMPNNICNVKNMLSFFKYVKLTHFMMSVGYWCCLETNESFGIEQAKFMESFLENLADTGCLSATLVKHGGPNHIF